MSFEPLSDKQKEQLGIDYGVQVTSLSDGKLKKAGINKGFVILKINDRPIYTSGDVDAVVTSIMQKGNKDDKYVEKAMFVVGIRPNGRSAYLAIDLSE